MSISATNIQMKNWQAGNTYLDWAGLDNVDLAVGYPWNGKNNWVLALKFTVSSVCESITISWCNAQSGYNENSATLRYKLCTAENNSYINATSATAGDGTFTLKGGRVARSTLTINKVLSAGTYYIYFWTNNSNASNWGLIRRYSGSYGVTVEYAELQGAVQIRVGGVWKSAIPKIYVSGTWKTAIPKVYTGGSWKVSG